MTETVQVQKEKTLKQKLNLIQRVKWILKSDPKIENHRDLYVIDFDGVLAYCIDPEAEAKSHFMTLKYIKRNPDWHALIDDMAMLDGGADFIIVTARHPMLAKEISDLCYGWTVIGRDFDLKTKKMEKRTQPVNLDRWMRKVVRFKKRHLKRFAKKRPHVFFLDDDWKWYERVKLKDNVVLLKPQRASMENLFKA